MPLVQLNRATCHYRIDGRDDRPVLVLAHALGLDHGMWDAQVAGLMPHLRILRYDLRGHGGSGAAPGDLTIAALGADVCALADALGITRFAFCGQSLGGMVGIWIGANAPERLTHLVLANTSARSDPDTMEARRRTVLDEGMRAIAATALARFFSAPFLQRNPPAVDWTRRTLLAMDPQAYAACCAAIRDMDQRDALARIPTPTLVLGGECDESMPWERHGRVLAESIPGARSLRLPAAHISCLEVPRAYNAAIAAFLLQPASNPAERGSVRRREVLGDEHVDRAEQSITDFTRAFQNLITQYVWGTIWARPGLDDRTRRLLVLALTAALGRWEEFRLHFGRAIDGGTEECDIEEVLLQVAVYAGVPVANTAFTIGAEELAKRDAGGATPLSAPTMR